MGNQSTTGSRARQGSGEDGQGPIIGIRKDFDMSSSRSDSSDIPAGTFKTATRAVSESRVRSISLSQSPSGLQQPLPKTVPVVFKWDVSAAKTVYLSGSFDNWKKKHQMAKSHEEWYIIIDVPEGSHQYKFHVDGQWMCNPNEPSVSNSYGTSDNVVTVTRSDFNVFDALETDEVFVKQEQARRGANRGSSGSPTGDYGQVIPPRNQGMGFHSGPPILPPHLLQVILNKDIPQHCEPTLLPEPNHVMLNHLYALSIKDGVMVLSSTHRYRKKYVTTLLYKPIS